VNAAFDFNNDEVNVTQTNGLGFTISGNMSAETWSRPARPAPATSSSLDATRAMSRQFIRLVAGMRHERQGSLQPAG
jgi:hypothetical protein